MTTISRILTRGALIPRYVAALLVLADRDQHPAKIAIDEEPGRGRQHHEADPADREPGFYRQVEGIVSPTSPLEEPVKVPPE